MKPEKPVSRGKALTLNMFTTLLSELITFVSGLILPRLILLYFGSGSNGLVSSISQFLGFSVVLRAGMGGAIRAALYKPLAEHDGESISAIMSATNRYMRKIGVITGSAILAFSFVYPFIVRGKYDPFYAFIMVLIIGFSTFGDSFFGVKYKILLQAEQKYYIQIGVSTIANILNIILSIILITSGCSLTVIKLGTTITTLANPLLLGIYVRRHYAIDWKAKPDYKAIGQRWNAFFQQLAVIVNQNVDLMILTVMVSLEEVSVYTIHFMVVSNVGKIANSCITGVNSTFGDLYARGEMDKLRSTFAFVEWLTFAVSVVFYSICAVMLTPFISLYTRSITDVDYIRPLFGLFMVLATFMNTVKTPYQMLAEGAGKFRETRNGAVFEVIVNIATSLICVYCFGIIGVLIGTMIAALVRTSEYSYFCFKHLLKQSFAHILFHFCVIVLTFTACYFAGRYLTLISIGGYLGWVLNACISTLISVTVVLMVSLVLYRPQLMLLKGKIFEKFKKSV